LRRHSVDALHLHRTQDLSIALPAADLAGVKHRVLTLQMESNRTKRDLYHRWVYGRLTAVLTITERMRRLVVDNVAVDPNKVRCNYYGVDVDELRAQAEPKGAVRGRWGVAQDAFVVGMVGRIESLKGQELLLRAGALLTGRISKTVVMLVGDETIGQRGELERLKRFASGLKPRPEVVFTGYQSPPGRVVPAFDVSVLASRRETFGLVILEAQALGVPVVATAAGGVPEVIEDDLNGLLLPPDDPEALAGAIERLYRDKDLRQRLADAALRTVRERFSLKEHLIRLESALRGNLPHIGRTRCSPLRV